MMPRSATTGTPPANAVSEPYEHGSTLNAPCARSLLFLSRRYFFLKKECPLRGFRSRLFCSSLQWDVPRFSLSAPDCVPDARGGSTHSLVECLAMRRVYSCMLLDVVGRTRNVSDDEGVSDRPERLKVYVESSVNPTMCVVIGLRRGVLMCC